MSEMLLKALMGASGGPGNQFGSMFNPAAQYAPKKKRPSLLSQGDESNDIEVDDEQQKLLFGSEPVGGGQSSKGGSMLSVLNPRAFGSK